MRKNAKLIKKRFKDHPYPTMHGIVDVLISDSKNSCVLLGQRNKHQVSVAQTLGETMNKKDIEWVLSLYKN